MFGNNSPWTFRVVSGSQICICIIQTLHWFHLHLFILIMDANLVFTTPIITKESLQEKITIFLCKNEDADWLCNNFTADQCLCICFVDSMMPLLPKFEISSF